MKKKVLSTFSIEEQEIIKSFYRKVSAQNKNKSRLTKEERSAHARKMALARWAKRDADLTSNNNDDIV